MRNRLLSSVNVAKLRKVRDICKLSADFNTYSDQEGTGLRFDLFLLGFYLLLLLCSEE